MKTINKHLDLCGQLFKSLAGTNNDRANPFFRLRFNSRLLNRRARDERPAFSPKTLRSLMTADEWGWADQWDSSHWVAAAP